MGTVSGGAAGTGKPEQQRRAVVRRAAAAAWLVVIGVVVEQGAQGLFSGQPPALLTWLVVVVSWQGDQPLWLKLLSLLAVLVVGALGWLLSLAWRKAQDDELPTLVQGGIALAGGAGGRRRGVSQEHPGNQRRAGESRSEAGSVLARGWGLQA